MAEVLVDATLTTRPGVDVIDAPMVVVTLAEFEPVACPDVLTRVLLGPTAREPEASRDARA
jgi:hypothetical protein